MGQVTEVDLSEYAVTHYKAMTEESDRFNHNRIMAKVQECMGDAELEGDNQDLICQLLIEDKVLQPLMDIVANVQSNPDMSFSEAKYAVVSARKFVTALENRLYEHFKD